MMSSWSANAENDDIFPALPLRVLPGLVGAILSWDAPTTGDFGDMSPVRNYGTKDWWSPSSPPASDASATRPGQWQESREESVCPPVGLRGTVGGEGRRSLGGPEEVR